MDKLELGYIRAGIEDLGYQNYRNIVWAVEEDGDDIGDALECAGMTGADFGALFGYLFNVCDYRLRERALYLLEDMVRDRMKRN